MNNASAAFTNTGTYRATNEIRAASATNTPRRFPEVVVNVTNISAPSALTVTNDGNEMVRLAWTDPVGRSNLVVWRSGAPITGDPTNSGVYATGDTIGGGTVIFKGSAGALEHVVSTNSTNYYRVYTINNNRYSTNASGVTTTSTYRAKISTETFSYTNGVSLSALNGGQDWTNIWNVTGTWTNTPSFSSSVTGIQEEHGNAVASSATGTREAYRGFPPVGTGKVYFAFMFRYGADDYAGLSFYSDAGEEIFIGELGGNANNFGINVSGETSVGKGVGSLAVNTNYTFLGYVDMSANQIRAMMVTNTPGVVTVAEPANWTVSNTFTTVQTLKRIRLATGSTAPVFFDEIRLATNWNELIGVEADTPYTTNYAVNAGQPVTDAQVTSGVFSVSMDIRSASGVSTSNVNPYFAPNFDLWNPLGIQILTNEQFDTFSFVDSGRTVIGSDASHVGSAVGNVALGTYTSRFSAISSNAISAIDVSTMSNNTPMTFTVVDDDTNMPSVGHLGSGDWEVYFNEPDQETSSSTTNEMLIRDKLLALVDQLQTNNESFLSTYTFSAGSGCCGFAGPLINSMNAALDRGARVHLAIDQNVDTNAVLGGTNSLATLAARGSNPLDLEVDDSASGLVHSKLGLFDFGPTNKRVFVTSANFTGGSQSLQWNVALEARSEALFRAYSNEFAELMAGRFHDHVTKSHAHYGSSFGLTGSWSTNVAYFAPSPDDKVGGTNILTEITNLIARATNRITFAIDSCTRLQVATQLVRAADRGVIIHGVMPMDQTSPGGGSTNFYKFLTNTANYASTNVVHFLTAYSKADHSAVDTGEQDLVHAKWMAIDPHSTNAILIHGSANWTDTALVSTNGNDENVLVLRHAGIAARFFDQFTKITGELTNDVLSAGLNDDLVVMVGTNRMPRVGVDSRTSIVIRVYDGALASVNATNFLSINLNAYDASGLNRDNTEGNKATNMQMTVESFTTSNVTNFTLAASAADSTLSSATNAWVWTNALSAAAIESLYGTTGSSRKVSSTMPDADRDRATADSSTNFNQQFGFLSVQDDDTAVPTISNFYMASLGYSASTVGQSKVISGGWSITGLAQDVLSGINSNGAIVSDANNNISPYFTVYNSTGTIIIATQLFSQVPGNGTGISTGAPVGTPNVTNAVSSPSVPLGIYTVLVVVADADADRTTDRTVTTNLFTFEVVSDAGAPSICAAPTNLLFETLKGVNPSPDNQSFNIENCGSGTLILTNVILYSSGGSGWATVSPDNLSLLGGQGFDVFVTVVSASLDAGTYYATNEIRSVSAGTNTVVITLVVSNTPTIGANTTLTYSVMLGDNPAAQTFGVTNRGNGVLNYTNNLVFYDAQASGWFTVAPTQGSLSALATNIHTGTVTSANAITNIGTYVATNTILAENATNSPRDVVVTLTVTNITVPANVTATNDGNELIRLNWTDPVGRSNLIVWSANVALSGDPTNSGVYAVGDSVGGGTVIYKGNTAGTEFEHVAATNTTNYYRFYTINNNRYSPPVDRVATTLPYAAVVYDQFGYTNGVGVDGLNGGRMWTTTWTTTMGVASIQSNFGNATFPNFPNMTNYPPNYANRLLFTSPGNGNTARVHRGFSPIVTGVVYAATLITYEFQGPFKFAGAALMSTGTTKVFFGKIPVNDTNTFGVARGDNSLDTKTSTFAINPFGGGTGSTGNVYLIVSKYDFSTRDFQAKAYYRTTGVPTQEPVTWDVTSNMPPGHIESFDAIRLSAGVLGAGDGNIGRALFDEIRVSTSWTDLVSFVVGMATNYRVGATNQIVDALVTSGVYNVQMDFTDASGMVTNSTFPNYDILNNASLQIVTNQLWTNNLFSLSGTSLSSSNGRQPLVSFTNVDLGTYTIRWSATSSNGTTALDTTALTNGQSTTFSVVDDDTNPPVLSAFALGSSLSWTGLWINEFEGDPVGGDDTNGTEWVELCGTAGLALSNYVFYTVNGAGCAVVTNIDMAGAGFTFSNEVSGFGFFVMGRVNTGYYGGSVVADWTPGAWLNAIRNSNPDFIGISNKQGGWTHAFYYGGVGGNCANFNSTNDFCLPSDAGGSDTQVLYMTGGPGTNFNSFTWTNLGGYYTPGAINSNQSFASVLTGVGSNLTDQQLFNGGWSFSGLVQDAGSGINSNAAITGNNFGINFDVFNSNGVEVIANQLFTTNHPFDGSAMITNALLSSTVSNLPPASITLGSWTIRVSAADNDEDRTNDRATVINTNVFVFIVTDDDIDDPILTNVFIKNGAGTTNFTDAEIRQGGYSISGQVRDASSGINNPGGTNVVVPGFSPNYDILNSTGTFVVQDRVFTNRPADGTASGSFSNIAMVTNAIVPNQGITNIDLGTYTLRISVEDNDADRTGDSQYLLDYTGATFSVTDDDILAPELTNFVVSGSLGMSTVLVSEITGGGWALTGLVRDVFSGVNSNDGITADTFTNIAPFFKIKNSTGGVAIVAEVFNQKPIDGGALSFVPLASVSVTSQVAGAFAPLGIYTAYVTVADNDEDRLYDRMVLTDFPVATFLVVSDTTGTPKVIDGNTNDWIGIAPTVFESATISSNEYIWIDRAEDERHDAVFSTNNNDIIDFRVAADPTNVYFLVKMRDIDNFAHPYIAIGVDVDQDPSDTDMNYLGDNSQGSNGFMGLGSEYYTNGNSRMHYPERNIIVHNINGTGQRIELHADDGVDWYVPPTTGSTNTKWSTTHNVLEFGIARADLLLTGIKTARFTVASFQNNEAGFANDIDTSSNYFSGDALDSISIYPYGVNASDLTMSAYEEETSDTDFDFWFDARFNNNGLGVNQLPTVPDTTNKNKAVAWPTNNAVIEPGVITFKWGASADNDDRVTSYFFELATNVTFDGGATTENGTTILQRINTKHTNLYFRLDPAPSQTQFFWRVRARDQSGMLSGYFTNSFQIQSPDDDTNGPVPFLVYVGSNYTPGLFQTNVTDADLVNSNNLVDIAISWTDPSGIFLTNHSPYTSTNLFTAQGRVIPNWDLFTTNTFNGSVSNFAYDRIFTNFIGANGRLSVTTWQDNAFTITNIDFSNTFFLTLSAEDEDNDRSSAPDLINDPGDDIPDDRGNTTNYLIQFGVVDDDSSGPFMSVGVNQTGTPQRVWINEFDYDAAGTDSNEWVEIAGLAGVAVSNYEFVTISQSGTTTVYPLTNSYVFPDEGQGFGFFVVGRLNPLNGTADFTPSAWTTDILENGPADSVQIRIATNDVAVHTIDYEGNNANTAQDHVFAFTDSGTTNSTVYLRGRGINFYDFAWTNVVSNATANAINSEQAFYGLLTDAQVGQGGYWLTGTIQDTRSGVMVDSAGVTTNAKPFYQLKNNAGTTLFNTNFTSRPANDGDASASPSNLSVQVAAVAKANIDLGIYTTKLTAVDADNDRANDRTTTTNQFVYIEVQDDDTNGPTVSGVALSGTGGNLAKAGRLVYYDFDIDSTNLETNVDTVVANMSASDIGIFVGTLASAAGSPGRAVQVTGSWNGTNNYFITFTIAPNYQVTLTNVVWDERSTATGPTGAEVRLVVGNVTNSLGVVANATDSVYRATNVVANTVLTGTNTIRIYAFSTSGAGNYNLDDLTVQGVLDIQAGLGLVTDQDLKNGTFTITGLVQDSVSGVFSNKNTNAAVNPSYSIFSPSAQILTNRSFTSGPVTNGDAQASAVPLADTGTGVNTNDIVIGTYTTLVYASDFDDDRIVDYTTRTNGLAFGVVDDDTNVPKRSVTTNMAMKLGAAVQSDDGGSGSNVLFNINDGSMRALSASSLHFIFYVNDESALVRGTDTNNLANLTSVTVTNWVTNNVSAFNATTSSPITQLGNFSTNVWTFTNSLTYDEVTALYGLTNKVFLTMHDADNDRANDRLSATNVQFGRFAVNDDDPSLPKSSTDMDPLYDLTTNASTFVFVGGDSTLKTNGGAPQYTNATGVGFAGTNVWVVDRNNPAADANRSNQIFLTSDGSLTNLSSNAPLHVKFFAFDAKAASR